MTMKTRIFSLILVVVMLTLSLAGCAYSYEKDDTSKYAAINKDAFAAALLDLKIDDADFGIDETKRQEKVEDAIIKSLASLVEGDDKGATKGTIDANDIVYYCYYATLEDGRQLYTSSMIKSTADSCKVQIGLKANEGRDKAIADVLLNLEIADGKAFTTLAADTASAEGQIAVVTYTVKGTDGAADVTYTNKVITLPAPAAAETEPTSIEQYLAGKKVGDVAAKTIGGTEYTGIKITQVITASTSVTATYTYDVKTEVAVVGEKDKVDIKDKPLTITVFPVKLDKVANTYTATTILKDLLGANITAGEIGNADAKGTLAIFTDADFKKGDKTVNALVKELIDLFADLAEKEDDLEHEKEHLKEAEDADKKSSTPETQQAVTEAKGKVTTAEGKVTEAEGKVDAKIAEIVAATKGEATAEATIISDYKKYRYESLKTSYENTIIQSLAKAIYDAALANITYTDTLPKKAVKETYDLILNNYEYDFYEGKTSDSSTTTNYDAYDGSLDAFLRDELELDADATKKDIKAAITKKAEASVKDTLVVYALKDVAEEIFADADFKVSKDDVDEFKTSYYYLILQYTVGTNNVKESYYMPALQLDKILDYMLEKGETGADNKVVIKSDKVNYSFK